MGDALDDAQATATAGHGDEPPKMTYNRLHQEVVFIHSEPFYRALTRLPVHRHRERMTLQLLLALARERERREKETRRQRPRSDAQSCDGCMSSGDASKSDSDDDGAIGIGSENESDFDDSRATEVAAIERRPRRCFGMRFLAPTLATYDQLLRFHSRDYIDTLMRADASEGMHHSRMTQVTNSKGWASHAGAPGVSQVSEQELQTYGLVDDAYVFPGLYKYCRYVAGATITAANELRRLMKHHHHPRDALPSDQLLGAAPVVINLGGGRHHAKRSQASGFCYVNDIVLGIQKLLAPRDDTGVKQDRVDRVLCVDIDVHHGDGVQEAFYFSDRVTTVSIHMREPTFFPGTGDLEEVGVGRGRHHSINLPLRRGVTDEQFASLFARIVHKAANQVVPDVVVLVCGVDTLARDSLGGFNLSSEGITACVKTLLALNRPMLVLGGGGYSGADACKCLAAVVTTIADPEFCVHKQRVPEHSYFASYGPDFHMATHAVIHRPNENTSESLANVEHCALEVLEKTTRGSRRTDPGAPRKRKR